MKTNELMLKFQSTLDDKQKEMFAQVVNQLTSDIAEASFNYALEQMKKELRKMREEIEQKE